MDTLLISTLPADAQSIVRQAWREEKTVLAKPDRRMKAAYRFVLLNCTDEWAERYAYPGYKQVVEGGAP